MKTKGQEYVHVDRLWAEAEKRLQAEERIEALQAEMDAAALALKEIRSPAFIRPIVEDQSCGEWGEDIVDADTAKICAAIRARAKAELDGSPAMMELIAERQGEIDFTAWAEELGFDTSAPLYAEAYVLALQKFEDNPSDYPADYAEKRKLDAAEALLKAAGWDPEDCFYSLDEAVTDVFTAKAADKNNEGPVSQVAFLLSEGLSPEEISRMVKGDSPEPA